MEDLTTKAHGQNTTLSEVARNLLRVDDLDGADRIVEAGIGEMADYGTTPFLWQLRFVRAEILRLRGKPEEALRYLEFQASANPPERVDVVSQVGLLMHRGYHLGLMARFRRAHLLLAEAEHISLETELIELQAETHLRQAMVFFLQRDYAESDYKYRKVLKLSEAIDGWYFRGCALWGIGKNLMIQRHYREAVPWLEKSLKIFEDAGAQLSIATVRGEMGVCHLASETTATRWSYLKERRKSISNLARSTITKLFSLTLAIFTCIATTTFTALSYYEKARRIAREIKDPVSVKRWTYNTRFAYARIMSAVDAQYPRPV